SGAAGMGGHAAKASSANDARLAVAWTARVVFQHVAVERVVVVPVAAPLPQVAVRVVQSPGVGTKLAHRMRSQLAAASAIPGILAQTPAIIAKRPQPGAPCAAGVFPFRL